ncbi:MAG TPA: zinc-ribbon domain-containing protein [Ktedonobacterales bacterium]|nr:zinc-ribbon domain-containing protein [Ktedonobacterales bacterium]
MLHCPYCLFEVSADQTICSHCAQALPEATPGSLGPTASAAQAGVSAPALAPAREGRHHWIWLGNLITLGVGGWILAIRWQGGTGQVIGVALMALALLSLALSRFGTYWQRASCLVKALILPGVLAGMLVLLIAAIESLTDTNSDHDGQRGDSAGGDGGGREESGRPRRASPAAWKVCPSCGQAVPAAARFCLRCGHPL